MCFERTRVVVNRRRDRPPGRFDTGAETSGAGKQVDRDGAARTRPARLTTVRVCEQLGPLDEPLASNHRFVAAQRRSAPPDLPSRLRRRPGDHTSVLSLQVSGWPTLGCCCDAPVHTGVHIKLVRHIRDSCRKPTGKRFARQPREAVRHPVERLLDHSVTDSGLIAPCGRVATSTQLLQQFSTHDRVCAQCARCCVNKTVQTVRRERVPSDAQAVQVEIAGLRISKLLQMLHGVYNRHRHETSLSLRLIVRATGSRAAHRLMRSMH